MIHMIAPTEARRCGLLLGLLGTACLALAACGGSGERVGSASDATSARSSSAEHSRRAVEDAVALLEQGRADAARKKLAGVLQRYPHYPIALKLLKQIDTDPNVLLGSSSVPYKVRAGENFTSLARTHLGDAMMFYALARYNGVERPDSLMPGQTIRLPKPPKAAGKPKTRKPEATARKAPQSTTKATPAPSPGRAAPVRATPRGNPALAARLRGAALKAMNNGEIDRAIGLLRQAQGADPTNAAIKADLARAARIRETLTGH